MTTLDVNVATLLSSSACVLVSFLLFCYSKSSSLCCFSAAAQSLQGVGAAFLMLLFGLLHACSDMCRTSSIVSTYPNMILPLLQYRVCLHFSLEQIVT